MLMLKQKYLAGFTIVELLVAIVVISILAGIVYISYEGYERNAQASQVASTVSAYKEAITTGVQFETDTTPSYGYTDGDFLAACISTNDERCCFYSYFILDYDRVQCANNTELKNEGYIDTDYTYTIINKYVDSKKAQLPNFSNYGGSLSKCTNRTVSAGFTPRCYTNEIAYTNDFTTGYLKGFINYYLPSSFDTCYSNNVVSFDEYGNFQGVDKNAKYTSRVTTGNRPFTYCMIAIDSVD